MTLEDQLDALDRAEETERTGGISASYDLERFAKTARSGIRLLLALRDAAKGFPELKEAIDTYDEWEKENPTDG